MGLMSRSARGCAAADQVPKGTRQTQPSLLLLRDQDPQDTPSAPIAPPGATEEGEEEDGSHSAKPGVSGTILGAFQIFNHLKLRFNGWGHQGPGEMKSPAQGHTPISGGSRLTNH